MLKKFLIGTALVALFAFAMTVSAADFGTTTLRVGSKGEAVMAVQTLVGAVADGNFGPMTKAKVQVWQAANGLTADGVFGNMSKAKANAGSTVATSTGCPAGALFNSLTGASCTAASTSTVAGCTAGAAFSSTTGASCATGAVGTVSTVGAEGSVTVTYDAVPANSLAVNKGETKSVMGIKVKATGSDMKVSRLWLGIDTRVWLYADTVTLLDGSTVLATMPLSSSTVTEVTAGSAWRLEFNNLNFVVAKDTTKVLTVQITRPELTSQSGTITVNVGNVSTNLSSLRAVDGAGITDTYTLGARAWSLANVASAVGDLTATLASTSPAAQSVSGLSTTSGQTTAIKLMDINLKATDGPVNITAMAGHVITTTGTDVASVELRDGTNVLSSVGSITTAGGSGTAVSFTDLNIDVAQDATKVVSIWALVNPVLGSNVVAGDTVQALLNTSITATTGTDFVDASLNSSNSNTPAVTGNVQHLFQYAPSITLGATTATVANNSGVIDGDYSIAFTVTAPTGKDIYVSNTVAVSGSGVIALSSSGTASDTLTASSIVGGGSDGDHGYIVPAGTSRTFTVNSHVPHGSAGYTSVSITQIPWTSSASTTEAAAYTMQNWGLTNPDFKTAAVYLTL